MASSSSSSGLYSSIQGFSDLIEATTHNELGRRDKRDELQQRRVDAEVRLQKARDELYRKRQALKKSFPKSDLQNQYEEFGKESVVRGELISAIAASLEATALENECIHLENVMKEKVNDLLMGKDILPFTPDAIRERILSLRPLERAILAAVIVSAVVARRPISRIAKVTCRFLWKLVTLNPLRNRNIYDSNESSDGGENDNEHADSQLSDEIDTGPTESQVEAITSAITSAFRNTSEELSPDIDHSDYYEDKTTEDTSSLESRESRSESSILNEEEYVPILFGTRSNPNSPTRPPTSTLPEKLDEVRSVYDASVENMDSRSDYDGNRANLSSLSLHNSAVVVKNEIEALMPHNDRFHPTYTAISSGK